MGNPSDILILFGATGDLVAKKILPALDQWADGTLPYSSIWCLGRRPFETDTYLAFIEGKGGMHLNDALRGRIHYAPLEFESPMDYIQLKERVCIQGDQQITCYLAVKPEVFVPIAANLSASGLFMKGNPAHKLVFEKPFGDSLNSARRIQGEILELAEEQQVYRIDHYLGKDMIRNILALRFGNRIFEESWNGRVLSSVRIISRETAGVEERLDYYDKAGAINDMVQSHLLQLLALVAMDAPADFESESIRRRKLEVMKRLVLAKNDPVLVGQYSGYREISPAFSDSVTETYVKAVLEVDLPEWEATRFTLETGKKMGEKRMEIILEFQTNPLCISKSEQISIEPNQIIIQVYPKEGVHLRFNSKAPGYDFRMEPVEADYCHACRSTGNKPEAYVKLLLDVQAGDKTLFAGCEEVELQWIVADKIREAASQTDLWIYEEGML